MSRMTGGYELTRPSGVCAATGRPIAEGQAYVAALVEREVEGALERLDYSPEAWAGGARPGAAYRLVGTWRAVMRPAGGPARAFIGDAELLDLFEQLGQATGQRQQAFRYILALMLVRKRLLRCTGVRRGGTGEVMVVQPTRAAGGGADSPVVEIADPGLDEQAISDATEQLAAVMLGQDGRPAPAQAPDAP